MKKKRKLAGLYREGAKGHCWECGRPEGEHHGGECPGFKEKNDVTGRRVRNRGRAVDPRGAGGVGIIR